MKLLAENRGEPLHFVASTDGYTLRRMICLMRELRRFKREGRVIHSSGIVPDLLNAFTGRKNGSSTLHNYLAPDYILEYGRLKGTVAAKLHRFALSRLSLIVACSSAVAKELQLRYGMQSVPCINGCADLPRTAKQATPKLPRSFSFAGPLIARKRVPIVVSAVYRFDPEARLQIFGSGPERPKVMAAVGAAKRARVGPAPAPAEHYEPGQFYISFAAFEGMPLAVLEALKAGMIPLLSRIPPHDELIRLLSIDTLKCFDSPDEGVQWACQLTPAFREALGEQIRVRAEQLFSERAFTSRFSSCIEQHFGN